MKINVPAIVAAWLLLNLSQSIVCAQGTAFTYQGQLQNNGSGANGGYDLQFTLYATNTDGVAVGGPVTNLDVQVSNGLFTTTIDFGPGVFIGASNWLDIAVETNGAGPFTELAPRQQLTPVPYAQFAETANAGGLSGTLDLATPEITSGGNIVLFANAGAGNFFAGPLAGNAANENGDDNEADGYQALGNDMWGSFNSANGCQALMDNTSGSANTANGDAALVRNTSGNFNTANGCQALFFNTTGTFNTADGEASLYQNNNGSDNTAEGGYALQSNASGNNNTAAGYSALLNLGAAGNGGTNNIALGYNAGISFVGNESDNIDIGNPGVRGESGVIRIGNGQSATYLSGTVYGNNVILSTDRNAKENFRPLDARAVLAKVAAMPITEWNYKTSQQLEHIGPMAEDFHAAFGLNGDDDKHISMGDEGGVALAAIQGLNEKLDEQSAENAQLKQENSSLAKRLDELEAQVKALSQNRP